MDKTFPLLQGTLTQNRGVIRTYLNQDISKMELFANIVKGFQPLIFFAKSFILDAWQGSD